MMEETTPTPSENKKSNGLPKWIQFPEWVQNSPVAEQWLSNWIVPEALRRGYKSVWIRVTGEKRFYLQPIKLTRDTLEVVVTFADASKMVSPGETVTSDLVNWDVFLDHNPGQLLLDYVELRWGLAEPINKVLFNEEVDTSITDVSDVDPSTPYGFIRWRFDTGEQFIYQTPEMRKNLEKHAVRRVEEKIEPHVPSHPTPSYLEIANSAVYYKTREIISQGQFSQIDGEKWPTGYIRCSDLNADVQIKPDPAAVEPYLDNDALSDWQSIAANTALDMNDETADVLDYITYEVVTQAANSEQDVTFSANNFNQLRGLMKHKSGSGRRGGFKTEYRRDFARQVEYLSNTWIRVAEMEVIEPDEKGKRRKAKKRGLESRAVVVSARAGQLNLGGRIEPDSFRGRLGPLFAASVFGTWRQTALVSIKALTYDPYRQLPEKRLTRYISWQWRIRQSFGNYLQPYEISTLLQATGTEINKKDPIRTKERLEKALDTLTEDGIISGWQYCEGWDEEIVGKRGWAEHWKGWKVYIEPPQEILIQYKAIPVMEAKKPKPLPASDSPIGSQIQDRRIELGLTQLQAAEEIGINQATLSRIERGANPAATIRKKLDEWLARTGPKG